MFFIILVVIFFNIYLGVGKGTLIEMLKQRCPETFGFSVSHTTRKPREGEVNGVHYNFVTTEEMNAAIDEGKLIEYAHVHTNIYGTSFEAVHTVQKTGRICILDIDTQGVRSLKNSSMMCHYLFIAPPSPQELESRLRERGTEAEDKIQVRLKNSTAEIEYGMEPGNFDAVVVNHVKDETYDEILNYLIHWYPTVRF